jgi:hypothetical protein
VRFAARTIGIDAFFLCAGRDRVLPASGIGGGIRDAAPPPTV